MLKPKSIGELALHELSIFLEAGQFQNQFPEYLDVIDPNSALKPGSRMGSFEVVGSMASNKSFTLYQSVVD